jgi:hypothetical protein
VHWLLLAEFAYNKSIHPYTSVMQFFAEKSFHPSIEATVWAIPAGGSGPEVPDGKARAEKLVELQAAIKQP